MSKRSKTAACLAAFTVTSLDDAGPGTLREAITLANATAAADTIDFAVTGVIHIGSQLPTITAPLTINGPGAELLTIDAGQRRRRRVRHPRRLASLRDRRRR